MTRSWISETDRFARVFGGHGVVSSLEHEHPNQHADNDRRGNHQPVAHGEILPASSHRHPIARKEAAPIGPWSNGGSREPRARA
jgi:hypothetical protein